MLRAIQNAYNRMISFIGWNQETETNPPEKETTLPVGGSETEHNISPRDKHEHHYVAVPSIIPSPVPAMAVECKTVANEMTDTKVEVMSQSKDTDIVMSCN